jgi:cation:H+ antiporter
VVTAGLFVGSLVLIVVASELFTNAVEWAGFRLRLASGATGSLLAALGTALPETAVPVVAILGHGPDADSIAVGAIVGAPFLLLTLGTGVTGLAVLLRRRDPVLRVQPAQVRRDLSTFALAFSLVLLAIPLPRSLRLVLAVAVLLIYGTYVRATLRGGAPATEMPEPLHLVRWRPQERPHGGAIAVQLLVAIALLIISANLFVDALHRTADVIHLSPLLLSLVLVPLATELPETLNSVLWVRSGDDGLAFGNIAGATAFQACIPGAIGLAFTDWQPGTLGISNGLITLVTALYTIVLLHDGRCRGWRLMLSALPWVAYVAVTATLGSRIA